MKILSSFCFLLMMTTTSTAQTMVTTQPPIAPNATVSVVPDVAALRSDLRFQQQEAEIKALQELVDAKIAALAAAHLSFEKRMDESLANDEKEHIETSALINQSMNAMGDKLMAADASAKAAVEALRAMVGQQDAADQKAAAKAEADFNKRIEAVTNAVDLRANTNADKIQDLKDRLASQEASLALRVAAIESRGEGAANLWGWVVGGIGLLLTLISIVTAVVSLMKPGPLRKL